MNSVNPGVGTVCTTSPEVLFRLFEISGKIFVCNDLHPWLKWTVTFKMTSTSCFCGHLVFVMVTRLLCFSNPPVEWIPLYIHMYFIVIIYCMICCSICVSTTFSHAWNITQMWRAGTVCVGKYKYCGSELEKFTVFISEVVEWW